MQSLKNNKVLHSPVTWGASGLVFALIVALVLAYLYYKPPGEQQEITFYTDDAVAISQGDDVRMAGVPVGKVEDVALEKDRVQVRARIKDDAFVGDQSQVDVRLRTIVGGYYVSIDSMGDRPLGKGSIPMERVTVPYKLTDALAATTKITDNVNAKPLNESLNDIQNAFTGENVTNVKALASIVDAGNSIMSTVDRQRGQITKILDMSDEYVQSLTAYRGELAQLIRKVSILVSTLTLYSKGLGNLVSGLGEVLLSLKPVGDFYERHRVEFVEKVRQYMHKTLLFVERNGVTVRLLQRVQNLFDRVLNAQNARPALLATDLCIPVPGSPC